MITKVETPSGLKNLECSKCGQTFSGLESQTTSRCCDAPLLVNYHLQFSKNSLESRPWTMWRYLEVLPVLDTVNIISLGEGGTPLIKTTKNIEGLEKMVWLKDESQNPTGSFKARGLSLAISKAKEFGISQCIMPSAGNAGVAMAAYSAKAGMRSVVVFPKITPKIYLEECRAYGSEVILVDGLIGECGKTVNQINHNHEYFNISTLKEPYRIEGKKTMGYEIAEQFNWNLPDAILYPTGGGTGLIGIWKAFMEMKKLGWIKGNLPKMIAVQSERCMPVVNRWNNQNSTQIKPSIALGLNVPNPFGLELIIDCLKESNGSAVPVSESEIVKYMHKIWEDEGVLISPESASAFAAIPQLLKRNLLNCMDEILILHTGAGIKYLGNLSNSKLKYP